MPEPAFAAGTATSARPLMNRVGLAIAEATADDGRPAYSMSLPRIAESACDARLLTSSALGVWGLGGVEDEARLVITELMSNAVTHARRDYVRVSVMRRDLLVVRLAVADFSRDLPRLRAAGAEEERGRGLAIVEAVTAGRWGAEPRRWGKQVWADLEMSDE
ncbi:ATP-binding protein [Streptomyces sp. NBC_00523]|uniref:ATP-binding protein n=1 Tax=Streptomyces sp. NBC_00523 TaxID=2975765 RepID=UPI002E8058CE|nr:ATP-binding protein [Streptomyces sp. NBC_00523]WUC98285.1 ATP-binding protein [Streptomyces sp. NBC_00523]